MSLKEKWILHSSSMFSCKFLFFPKVNSSLSTNSFGNLQLYKYLLSATVLNKTSTKIICYKFIGLKVATIPWNNPFGTLIPAQGSYYLGIENNPFVANNFC